MTKITPINHKWARYNLCAFLVLHPLWACKSPPQPAHGPQSAPAVFPAEAQRNPSRGAGAGAGAEQSDFDSCVKMSNGGEACSCKQYQTLVCSGAVPDESVPSEVVASSDICLFGGAAPIQEDQDEGLYRAFLTVNLQDVRSSLRPRGVQTLIELESQGFTVSTNNGIMELRNDAWIYTVELFDVARNDSGDLYLARFTSTALQGTYHSVKAIVVVHGLSGTTAQELRQHFVHSGC